MIRSTRPTFEFAAFVKLFNLLEQPLSGEPRVVELDLSEHHFFGPSGMVPLIAVVKEFTERGWRFDVVPPNAAALDRYWHDAGWYAGITGEVAPPITRSTTYTPLVSYRSHSELNGHLNNVMEVLARVSEFRPGVLASVEWALNEVADNVLVHSESLGWLQVVARPNRGQVEAVVADCGLGINRTIREAFPDVADDAGALRMAIERGVTRDKAVGQGNGLAGTMRIAQANRGWVNIVSGTANLRLFDDGHFDDIAMANFPGTLVTLTLRSDRDIDTAEVLWGFPLSSSFEFSHVTDDGILFRLLDEATGFGNRGSGAELANKLQNLTVAFPGERVVIDFEGIDVATASFLDEFLAKMIKVVGVTTFFSRFSFRNMNDLVRRTADAVIAQRLSE